MLKQTKVALASIGLLAFSIFVAPAADAATYNLNRTIDEGTVTGFVETDGTLGVLATGNITDWVLTLTAPNLRGGSPDVISFSDGVTTTILGTALTATATQLIFDFSSAGGSYFLLIGGEGTLLNPNNVWCIQTSNCSTFFAAEVMGLGVSSSIAQSVTRSGQVVIAEVSAVPLPAALPLLGGALSLLGFFGWRRKRMAAA